MQMKKSRTKTHKRLPPPFLNLAGDGKCVYASEVVLSVGEAWNGEGSGGVGCQPADLHPPLFRIWQVKIRQNWKGDTRPPLFLKRGSPGDPKAPSRIPKDPSWTSKGLFFLLIWNEQVHKIEKENPKQCKWRNQKQKHANDCPLLFWIWQVTESAFTRVKLF